MKKIYFGFLQCRKSFLLLLLLSLSAGISAQQFYNNATAGTGNAFPLNNATNDVQWIFKPGLFKNSSAVAAGSGNITKIYFMISTTASATAVYSNFTIKLGQNAGTD